MTLVARPGLVDGRRAASPPARNRADGRRSRRCCPAGTPARSPPSGTAGPACRTRAASSSRWRSPPRRVDGRDERWLDLCAGPGGKAALLGGRRRERGARLVANEVAGTGPSWSGVRRGPDADVVVADGRRPPWPDEQAFDRVLVDAPCTGLGALRRRPEARWRRRPEDIAVLRGLQQDLLVSGLRSVRPGGVVAYVTCSPHLAETRVVVDDVLRRGGAERIDARDLLPGVPDLGDGPDVQLWPHVPRHRRDVPGRPPQALTDPEPPCQQLPHPSKRSCTTWRIAHRRRSALRKPKSIMQ